MKEERYGERDLCFSGWHRYQLNEFLKMRDLDCIEYCHRCDKPLALIEAACDVGQNRKWVKPMQELAKMAGLPAYVVFYQGNSTIIRTMLHFCTVHTARQAILKLAHVDSLRIRKVSPCYGEEIKLTPHQYHGFLIALRVKSKCGCYRHVPLTWWNEDEHTDVAQEEVEHVWSLLG
jgi:hypothetical protein